MDADTFQTLNIFKSDRHPSMQGIGGKKEGLSLYGLLSERCHSAPGKARPAQTPFAPWPYAARTLTTAGEVTPRYRCAQRT